ncbi:MAG: histidine phosphatase family protein [Cyclobacteriaceae bacterium]|nr:histidine phosphatase family protein [Cyclobacteriaceae bacterium]
MRVLIIILLVVAGEWVHAQSPTTFILLRHAEKVNDGTGDPELSEAGVLRAKNLMNLLQKNAIDAIYSTPYKRTRNTVMPLATTRMLPVQDYDGLTMEQIDHMIGKHGGGTVLVVGHSNTIPGIVNFLTGKNEYKNFEETEYGNLIIVTVFEKGKKTSVTWITY